MSELKCPFCQQELHKDSDGYYTCYTDNCRCMKYGGNGASGSESLWLALIRTKELLDVESAEHEMCHTQMLKTTEKLERTHKALEVAIIGLKNCKTREHIGAVCKTPEYVDKILEQITALERKDK